MRGGLPIGRSTPSFKFFCLPVAFDFYPIHEKRLYQNGEVVKRKITDNVLIV